MSTAGATRSISPFRVIGFAAVLGIVGGTAMSFRAQHQRDLELQQLASEPDRGAPVDAPPGVHGTVGPGKPLGRLPVTVHLTATEGLPQYPGANVRSLSDQLSAQGVEMNIAWFSTKDEVGKVLSFYAKKFDEEHKVATAHLFSEKAGYVGYMDTDTRRMHLISAIRQGKETVVFPSSSYPGKMLEGKGQLPPSLPTVAGAEGNLAFDFGDGQRLSKMWLAMVRQKTLRQVIDQYKQALTEKGWDVKEAMTLSDAQGRVDAKQGKSEVQVDFKRDQAATVAVYVTMVEGS